MPEPSEFQIVMAQAILGRDAAEFLETDLGRFISGRAQQEIDDAVRKLKTVNPCAVEDIRTIQNDIWRAESFMGWLTGLINEGLEAERLLEQSEA